MTRAEFPRRLAENKAVVLLLILLFLHATFFSACSKSKERRPAEAVAAATADAPGKEADPGDPPPAGDGRRGLAGPIKPLSQDERDRLAGQLARDFQKLEELIPFIPRESFDPRAIVDKVGPDAADLFHWVRDQTRLVPYRGALRGPVGVLMDGFGNSLDRSLLLHELLRLAGCEARLAHGTLSERRAGEIAAKAARASGIGPSAGAGGRAPRTAAGTDEAFSGRFGSELAEFGKGLDRLVDDSRRTSEEVGARVDGQADFILKALQGARLAESPAPRDPDAAAYRDHWWVQWLGDDGWTDLDPAAGEPGAGPGIDDIETLQPEDIGDEMFHQVLFRVVIERWADGRVEEETVLEHPLRAMDLSDKRIRFGHSPASGSGGPDLWDSKDPAGSLRSYLLGEEEWAPYLQVGSERISRSSVTCDGEVRETPGAKGGTGVTGVAGGLFRALAGEEKTVKAPEGSVLLAESLEYEILVPGSPPRTVRRPIFDLIGPARREQGRPDRPVLTETDLFRRGLAFLGEHEILIQVCRIPAAYVLHLLAEDLLANRDVFLELFESRGDLDRESAARILTAIQPLPGPEYYFAVSRHGWNRSPDLVYQGRPNVVQFVRELRLGPDARPVGRSGLDIIANEVEVLPGGAGGPFLARLRQGVLDTNAEAQILRGTGDTSDNMGEILERAKGTGTGWLALQGADDPRWRELELPADVRAQIRKDLADGYVVLAPRAAIPLGGRKLTGWWRVDPRTGDALGMGPEGHGQAILEHAMLGVHIATFGFCIYESVESMVEGDVATGVLHVAYCVAVVGLTGVLQHVALSDMALRGASEIPFFIFTTVVSILAELGSGAIH